MVHKKLLGDKSVFGGLVTKLIHQQIIMLPLPIIPKVTPPFLVESAAVFSLQTQHLFADHQMLDVAQRLLPGGELQVDDMSTPLKVPLHAFCVLNVLTASMAEWLDRGFK